MNEIERIINKHFRKAWFLKIPVCISTPNELAKAISQHIIDELETAKGKTALAHYHTGKLDFSWIDHRISELEKGMTNG